MLDFERNLSPQNLNRKNSILHGVVERMVNIQNNQPEMVALRLPNVSQLILTVSNHKVGQNTEAMILDCMVGVLRILMKSSKSNSHHIAVIKHFAFVFRSKILRLVRAEAGSYLL